MLALDFDIKGFHLNFLATLEVNGVYFFMVN